MFTRCPECQKTHSVSVDQLRNNRGMMACDQCHHLFDSLTLISETEAEAITREIEAQNMDILWEKESQPDSEYWRLGVYLAFVSLIAQIVSFEGYGFTQNPKLRPLLAAICKPIHCPLPDYQNLNEFNVIGSFNPTPDKNYELRAAISNQADFAQPFPDLKLTLLNYNGDPFASRVFKPRQYLPGYTKKATLNPEETKEINLKILAPKSMIGGSNFKVVN